jgi:hypothetical protein
MVLRCSFLKTNLITLSGFFNPSAIDVYGVKVSKVRESSKLSLTRAKHNNKEYKNYYFSLQDIQ